MSSSLRLLGLSPRLPTRCLSSKVRGIETSFYCFSPLTACHSPFSRAHVQAAATLLDRRAEAGVGWKLKMHGIQHALPRVEQQRVVMRACSLIDERPCRTAAFVASRARRRFRSRPPRCSSSTLARRHNMAGRPATQRRKTLIGDHPICSSASMDERRVGPRLPTSSNKRRVPKASS